MNKILLELVLPACGKSIEMRVPLQLKVAEARDMLVRYLTTLEEYDYLPSSQALLCDYSNGKPYNPNLFIVQLGLSNGSRIMLI